MERAVGRVLIAGFEPYGGRAFNPAAEVAKALDGAAIAEHRVVGCTLPVAYRGLADRLEALLAEHRPAVAICLGLAPGEAMIRLERFGHNLADFEIADNDGLCAEDEVIAAGGATALAASLPLRAIERELLAAGIPARLSSTAGTFLCNAALYHLMRVIAAQSQATLGGFIHLPYMPEQVAQLLAAAKRERRVEALRCDIASMDLALATRALRIAIAISVSLRR